MILVYHCVCLFPKNENQVDLLHFIIQMFKLWCSHRKGGGNRVVSLEEYINSGEGTVICFDDGNKCIKIFAVPILRLFNFPFEIFICEDFVKNGDNGSRTFLNSKELREMVKNGAHLQYHSKTHADLTLLNKEELELEIKCSDKIKELDLSGFKYFAYPFWKYNKMVIDVVKKYYLGARSGNGYSNNTIWAFDAYKVISVK